MNTWKHLTREIAHRKRHQRLTLTTLRISTLTKWRLKEVICGIRSLNRYLVPIVRAGKIFGQRSRSMKPSNISKNPSIKMDISITREECFLSNMLIRARYTLSQRKTTNWLKSQRSSDSLKCSWTSIVVQTITNECFKLYSSITNRVEKLYIWIYWYWHAYRITYPCL